MSKKNLSAAVLILALCAAGAVLTACKGGSAKGGEGAEYKEEIGR